MAASDFSGGSCGQWKDGWLVVMAGGLVVGTLWGTDMCGG